MNNSDGPFDVVLWGATGFTGQLVAEYFATRYNPSNLNWAIGGRNEKKLERLRNRLAEDNSGWSTLPILTGDAFDRERLTAIANRTTVVCSTVGPYARFGTDLVAACAETGTNYCDLTGEIQWIREMIDRFHEKARSTGARIVHSCGFDSVPSDLGVLMLQERAVANYDIPCSRIGAFVSSGPAEFSGGTVASAVNLFEEASEDSSVKELLEDPYGLAPAGKRDGPDTGPQRWIRYDEDLKMWTAPFIMAITNEKIVRRSNAVLGYPYGSNFSYRECIPTGSGWKGALRATGIATGVATLTGMMSIAPLRRLLKRYLLPDPGDGPDRDAIDGGSFEVRLVGRGESDGGKPFRVSGKISSNRDPGYGSTAWMLGESAICLALGETSTPTEAGSLTPASGIGMPLVDRLEQTGLAFEVTHQTLEGKE